MYDVRRMLAWVHADDPLDGRPLPEKLAAFTDELAEQLRNEAREREAKRTRGFKSFAEAVGVAVAELAKVSAALRKAVPAEQAPVECKAVNQLGVRCERTDAGHEAHTYPAVEPNVVHDDLTGGAFVVEPGTSPDQMISRRACGAVDQYTTHVEAGAGPDRCLLDPQPAHARHKGRWSEWPDQVPATAEAAQAKAENREKIRAFLAGETDELGTEPLPFIEPRGDVAVTGALVGPMPALQVTATDGQGNEFALTVTDPDDAAKITADVLSGYTVAVDPATPERVHVLGVDATLYSWGPVSDPLPGMEFTTPGGIVTPDPFDNALPDPRPAPSGVWMGGAQPVEPDPRPLWLDPGGLYGVGSMPGGLPRSIRTTHVRTGEQCGLAYRLLSRDQVEEVPSWANIGGSTLHACAMRYESAVIEGMAPEVLDEATARAWWNYFFPLEISNTETESPFRRAYWRAADKGAEGEAWWNEAGPLMVRDYSAWSAQMHADGWSILRMAPRPGQIELGSAPAMELEMHTPLITGEISGHLDQAWIRSVHLEMIGPPDVSICVIDLKSGSRMPEDDWQLQAYPWGLRYRLHSSGMAVERITWSAAYYDARNGKLCDPITPRMDDAEINYRASSVLRMHETNNYPANPGTTYKDPCYVCSVRYACPIMARRTAQVDVASAAS